MSDTIGHRDYLVSNRDRVLASSAGLSERAKARILGVPYVLPPAKEHRITVNAATGARTVEEIKYVAPTPKPAPKPTPKPIPGPASVVPINLPPISSKTRLIMRAVAEAAGFEEHWMLSPTKQHRYSHPRQLAMAWVYLACNKSSNDIGRMFGNRDHSTVLHAIRVIPKRLDRVRGAQALYQTAHAAVVAQWPGVKSFPITPLPKLFDIEDIIHAASSAAGVTPEELKTPFVAYDAYLVATLLGRRARLMPLKRLARSLGRRRYHVHGQSEAAIAEFVFRSAKRRQIYEAALASIHIRYPEVLK